MNIVKKFNTFVSEKKYNGFDLTDVTVEEIVELMETSKSINIRTNNNTLLFDKLNEILDVNINILDYDKEQDIMGSSELNKKINEIISNKESKIVIISNIDKNEIIPVYTHNLYCEV